MTYRESLDAEAPKVIPSYQTDRSKCRICGQRATWCYWTGTRLDHYCYRHNESSQTVTKVEYSI